MSVFDRLRGLFRRSDGSHLRQEMLFVGRARLISHLCEELGEEAASEYSYDAKPPGFEPLLVFEFAPWRDRTWWTYATAGLSLCPSMDDHPPTELVAYAHQRAEGLIDLLCQLSFRGPSDLSYRAGDIVSFDSNPPDLGVPLGRDFALLEAPEQPALLAFPDPAARAEDARYVMARPGEDDARVQFLRVVALRDAIHERLDDVRASVAASRVWQLY